MKVTQKFMLLRNIFILLFALQAIISAMPDGDKVPGGIKRRAAAHPLSLGEATSDSDKDADGKKRIKKDSDALAGKENPGFSGGSWANLDAKRLDVKSEAKTATTEDTTAVDEREDGLPVHTVAPAGESKEAVGDSKKKKKKVHKRKPRVALIIQRNSYIKEFNGKPFGYTGVDGESDRRSKMSPESELLEKRFEEVVEKISDLELHEKECKEALEKLEQVAKKALEEKEVGVVPLGKALGKDSEERVGIERAQKIKKLQSTLRKIAKDIKTAKQKRMKLQDEKNRQDKVIASRARRHAQRDLALLPDIVNSVTFADGTQCEASSLLNLVKDIIEQSTTLNKINIIDRESDLHYKALETAIKKKILLIADEVFALAKKTGRSHKDVMNAKNFIGQTLLHQVVYADNDKLSASLVPSLSVLGGDERVQDAQGLSVVDGALHMQNVIALAGLLSYKNIDSNDGALASQDSKRMARDMGDIRPLDDDGDDDKQMTRALGLHHLIDRFDTYDQETVFSYLGAAAALNESGDLNGLIIALDKLKTTADLTAYGQEVVENMKKVLNCYNVLSIFGWLDLQASECQNALKYAMSCLRSVDAFAMLLANDISAAFDSNNALAQCLEYLPLVDEKLSDADKKLLLDDKVDDKEAGFACCLYRVLKKLRLFKKEGINRYFFLDPIAKIREKPFDKNNQTLLHIAATHGSSLLLPLLQDYGESENVQGNGRGGNLITLFKNIQDGRGFTPLHCAVEAENTFAVALLLNHNARYDILSHPIVCPGKAVKRKTACYMAFESDNKEIIIEFVKADMKQNSKALLLAYEGQYGHSAVLDYPELVEIAAVANAPLVIQYCIDHAINRASSEELMGALFDKYVVDLKYAKTIGKAIVKRCLSIDACKTVEKLETSMRVPDVTDVLSDYRDEKTGDTLVHTLVKQALHADYKDEYPLGHTWRYNHITTFVPNLSLDTILARNNDGHRAMDLCFINYSEDSLDLAHRIMIYVIQSTNRGEYVEDFLRAMSLEQLVLVKDFCHERNSNYLVRLCCGYKRWKALEILLRHGFSVNGVLAEDNPDDAEYVKEIGGRFVTEGEFTIIKFDA